MSSVCRIMSCVILLCSSLFSVDSVYAYTGDSCDGNHSMHKDDKPLNPGCQRLEVVVYNMTQYTFVSDSSTITSGSTHSFPEIPPSSQLSPTTLYVDGATIEEDVVNATAHYYAQKDGGRKGPALTLNLQKDACHSHQPIENIFNDDHCYSEYDYPCPTLSNPFKTCKTCELDGSCDGGSTTCLFNSGHLQSDGVCDSDYYAYEGFDCNGVTDMTPSNVRSSVSVNAGLYTLGALLNAEGAVTGFDVSKEYTNDAHFVCDRDSVCGPDDHNCDSGGGPTDNRTAKTVFYIYPSPVETLTVTFPFNTQSPIGRIMKSVIYNNLDTTSLASLGAFYSLNPVGIQDASIAFSTLCNANNCPKP